VSDNLFDLTSRAVSVGADCTPQYVGQLAIEKLVPHIVASDGTRLFTKDAVPLVRRIKAERLARRGRSSAAA
jgi:hypothetical protein